MNLKRERYLLSGPSDHRFLITDFNNDFCDYTDFGLAILEMDLQFDFDHRFINGLI